MRGFATARLLGKPVAPAFHRTRIRVMDIEHINAIGSTLADLTQRTLDLRGYL